MFNFLFNSPAWQLIIKSDWMTQLVLFGLFIVSVACVAIVAFKIMTLNQHKKTIIKLSTEIKQAESFSSLVEIGKEFKEFLPGTILTQILTKLKKLLESKGSENQTLTEQDFEDLVLTSDHALDKILLELEIYLPVLGTSAAVGPLVGLFGTVWGLIHSFVNISQEKSADISIVAPGIAEALITTLAGLIVAIPAMIMFHFFSNKIRKLEMELGQISDKALIIVKNNFVKNKGTNGNK